MHHRPPIDPPWRAALEKNLAELEGAEGRQERLDPEKRTAPFDPARIDSVRDFVEALEHIGFQARGLGRAYRVWRDMLADPECLISLGVSGALVPAGLGRLLAQVIRMNAVDVIVSTGAQVYHDLHEATGGYHYHVTPGVSDDELRDQCIDRFYNVAADDCEMQVLDHLIARRIDELPGERGYSTREIIEHLAPLSIHPDTWVKSAVECGKPVYVPTFHDSSMSFGLTKQLAQRGHSAQIDFLRDNVELYAISRQFPRRGVVLIGGGVPKNYIQQIEPLAEVIDGVHNHTGGLQYGIQFTAADVRDGGLSGCTMSESKSWGKYQEDAHMVQVWGEATITFSLCATAVYQAREEFAARPRRRFRWASDDPKSVTIET